MMLETPTDKRKRRTHTAVLDAARSLFLEHGYRSTSIEMLAGAADVAVSSIYANFAGGKADVYAALAWHTTTTHVDEMKGSTSIVDAFDRYVAFHRENPLALRLLSLYDVATSESELVAHAKPRIDEALQTLVETVTRDITESGCDTDPRVLVLTTWAAANGAVSLRQRGVVDDTTLDAMLAITRSDLQGHITEGPHAHR
ncbi:TetR/AcrR family transcriptional regulator [Rhodococcus sovatensis]|uniref:TetR/AcrR family transcriptional regulator n=1 Tax=Rhodococcus sovatensis TaxID=1805840 RepID=A0ABZ2PQ75_9NOCA